MVELDVFKRGYYQIPDNEKNVVIVIEDLFNTLVRDSHNNKETVLEALEIIKKDHEKLAKKLAASHEFDDE